MFEGKDFIIERGREQPEASGRGQRENNKLNNGQQTGPGHWGWKVGRERGSREEDKREAKREHVAEMSGS